MVKQLMNFGNFMIGQLYAEWLDNPQAGKDFGAWLRKRETTLADLQAFEDKHPEATRTLPSNKQLNDVVTVDFGENMKHESAKVVGVHFTEAKVSYDLELPFEYKDNSHEVFLENVDSAFVK